MGPWLPSAGVLESPHPCNPRPRVPLPQALHPQAPHPHIPHPHMPESTSLPVHESLSLQATESTHPKSTHPRVHKSPRQHIPKPTSSLTPHRPQVQAFSIPASPIPGGTSPSHFWLQPREEVDVDTVCYHTSVGKAS